MGRALKATLFRMWESIPCRQKRFGTRHVEASMVFNRKPRLAACTFRQNFNKISPARKYFPVETFLRKRTLTWLLMYVPNHLAYSSVSRDKLHGNKNNADVQRREQRHRGRVADVL